MKLFLALGMILLVVPSVFSFDCNQFTDINKENCINLSQVNEDLIAGLIYTNTSRPDYDFVQNYNSKIIVSKPPENTSLVSKTIIKNAWIRIFSISPAIFYKGLFFVPDNIQVRSESNYSIQIPANYNNPSQSNGAVCKIDYSLASQGSNTNVFNNDIQVASGKIVQIPITQNSTLKTQLTVSVSVKADQSNWQKYCCKTRYGSCVKYCYRCKYQSTSYITETLKTDDKTDLKKFESTASATAEFIQKYYNTSKGIINLTNTTSFVLTTDNSTLKEYNHEYYARFTQKPYYFLVLEAVDQKSVEIENLFLDRPYFFVPSDKNCRIEYFDFFNTKTSTCISNYSGTLPVSISKPPDTTSLSLLMKLLVFGFIVYLAYRIAKKYWGKYFLSALVLILILPSVKAEDCGITNIASCIPEKMYDFFINLINSPLQPLLSFLKTLLESPPMIDLLNPIWKIMVYCISFFYVFLILYSGFQFIFSGHDVIRRELAKEWLKNTVVMIVLVQASFYIYGLSLSLSSIFTSSMLTLVDPNFFLLTADNLSNIGLELMFTLSYVLVLIFTVFLLTIRYLMVVVGVIFVPFGIFFYFIPPLKSYGKMILNLLGMLIFITCISSIIILGCSKLITIEVFQNFKIVVTICCFLAIDFLFFLLGKHIVQKSGLEGVSSKVSEAVKFIGMIA